MVVQSWLSCLSCPVPAVVSCLFELSSSIIPAMPACHRCPNCPLQLACPTNPVPAACLSTLVPQFHCPHFPVHPIMFWLPCSSVLTQVQANMSQLSHSMLTTVSCPSCPVLAFLLQLSCPSVLSRFSCPNPVLAVKFGPSSLCLVQDDMIRLTFPANLSRPSCSSCPVQAILSQLSCPGCLIHGCRIKVVRYQLSCSFKH
jgi:hypothetical protein